MLALVAVACGQYDPTTPATTLQRTLEATTTGPAAPGSVPAEPTAACSLVPHVRCPDPKLTPGPVIPSVVGGAGQVCQTTFNPRRDLTPAAKRRVLAGYGLPAGTPVAEWDHLVARWAGGTSTSSNVWPQTSSADKTRKDRLESRLYLAVCKGSDHQFTPEQLALACGGSGLTLDCAQQMMREFWQWWQ